MPEFSYDIVIPNYNRAHVIGDAVNSILSQNPLPQKIIIVDDASSDKSHKKISTIQKQSHLVHPLYLKNNKGVSHARNKDARLCVSKWILFLDSDDVLCSNAIKQISNLSFDDDTDVLAGNFHRIDIQGNIKDQESLWQGDNIQPLLMHKNILGPSWSFIKRELFQKIGGFQENLRTCEDWMFFLQALKHNAKFMYHPIAIAYYRTVSGDRLMNDTNQLNADEKIIQKFIKENFE